MKDTLWITGVCGFTGRHQLAYVRRLPDRPRIVGLDVADKAPDGVDVYVHLDLNDVDKVAGAAKAEPPRWVIHLAAARPPATEQEMWRANVGGTAGLLAGLGAGAGNIRVVNIGSAAEYVLDADGAIDEGHRAGGASLYGRIKWAQSMLALSAGTSLGMEVLVVRPFNLLGPGLPSSLVAGWICEQVASSNGSEEIVLGNTETARDFVDVRDAVEAYWLVACEGAAGEVYNVCSGEPTSIQQVLECFSELTGKPVQVRVDPSRLRKDDPPAVIGSAAKLRRRTGWKAKVPVRRSLADMVTAKVSHGPAGSFEP